MADHTPHQQVARWGRKGERLGLFVVSRQFLPHFACAPSHIAHDTSPLCSPSLHRNLTLFAWPWDMTNPGRATTESANSQREGCRGARAGSPGAVIGFSEHQNGVQLDAQSK